MTQIFFQNLYSSVGQRDYGPILAQCPIVVTDTMNDSLTAEVTREEVQRATFQLGATKAPGPDRLSSQFYQTHWDILQYDIFSSIKEFFTSGVLNPELNKTFITLIPKISHPERLDQY